MSRLAPLVVLLAGFLPLALFRAADEKVSAFADDSFADFAAGTLDAGGQNLYVSKDGKVRTVHRFDLNDDGHIDLLYNCTHDTYQMLPATVGTVGKGRIHTTVDVAVEGSERVVLGDLNADGFTDAVFCPNPIGVHGDRRHVWIAWGGPDGWAARRVNGVLPTRGAVAVALADLNADGRLDVVVLNGPRWQPGQPDGAIIRVYWNGPAGFSPVSYLDLGFPGATDLAAGDLGGDGTRDLVVLHKPGKASVVWGTKPKLAVSEVKLPADATCLAVGDATNDGRPDLIVGTAGKSVAILPTKANQEWGDAVSIPAVPATHIALGDADGDGAADLVLTWFAQSRAAGGEQAGAAANAPDHVHVLWGKRGEIGFRDSTKLPVKHAAATAIGDIDGDGRADVIVAVHQGETTFNGESVAFFGEGKRKFARGAAGFRTSGTTDVTFAAAEKGLPARAVFCNTIGGHLDEAVPLLVYWGGPKGFDRDRVWKIPFHSGYESSAADLNADGHTDLVCLNSGHAGERAHADPTLGANIFWGGPKGLTADGPRHVLNEPYLGTSTPADLDRDGYLDLVLEPFGPAKPGEADQLLIYYGGPDGFTPKRRVTLAKPGYGQEHLVADCNADGWLDVVLTSAPNNLVRILWGGPQGFSPEREHRLTAAGAIGATGADLNKDGHLDLIVTCYNDPASGHRDMGLLIFWGGPQGYRPADAQWVPGFAPLGRCVADLDGDGWLDLFSPQQSGELTREDLACHIYWGGPEGISRARRTTIFCDSVNAALAADFDGDGMLDLAVACHTRHGDHRAESRVFYNDGKRFENPRVQKLPTNGPHLLWATEIGHILDRSYRQTFTSRTFTWDGGAAGGTLTAKADLGPGRTLTFEVRSAADADGLAKAAWRPVADGAFTLGKDDRRVQYRAVFRSDNGDRFPVLDRVDVALKR